MRKPIVIALISIPSTEDGFEMFWNLLSNEEKNRGNSFVFKLDRWRYVFCRGCLRILLGKFLSCTGAEIIIRYLSYGKPYLGQDKPLKFNLSHTHNCLAISFSFHCEMGIDIEKIRPVDSLSLANVCLSEREKIQFDCCKNENEKTKMFFNLWTRKEALLKGMGIGLGLGVEILGNQNCLLNKIQIASQTWTFANIQAPENHAMALAYLGESLVSIKLVKFTNPNELTHEKSLQRAKEALVDPQELNFAPM